MKALEERVIVRLSGETVNDALIEELVETVSDRLCIRLGEEELPALFNSICVDATVKLYRRVYYEGISNEGNEGISTSFVEDVLSEYLYEIEEYKSTRSNANGSERVVKFL